MPRHPPYALFSLSLIRFRICSLPEIKKLSFQSLFSYFCKTFTSILTSFSLDDFAICFLPAYYSLSLSFLPSRYFSFQCFSLIMQLSMCESANLFYRPKGCKKSIMVFTTVNIRLCQRYCLFNTWSPNRMSDFDSQRLSQSIAYI